MQRHLASVGGEHARIECVRHMIVRIKFAQCCYPVRRCGGKVFETNFFITLFYIRCFSAGTYTANFNINRSRSLRRTRLVEQA